jgi:acetylcholinesterase
MDWAAKVLAALPLALVSLYPGPTSSIVPPTATLSYGAVQGIQTTLAGAEYPVNKFLGIPYAEPPQRFSPAAEVLPRKDPIKATAFGATCPQSFGVPGVGPDPVLLKEVFSNGVQPESEDCLTVNVFASAKRSSDLRPVLVFIYGGAWQISSSVQLDMSAFAAYEDIVGVTMNYRGTVFGFPSSPEIPLEQRNLGLLDQKLALQWVQKHIAKFGGDPTKVTIWGQSAGAMSVDSHLMANANDAKSRPFRAAVMSSGQLSFGIASLRATGHEAWDDLSNAVGCTDEADRLACMRAQPVGALQNAMRDLKSSFWPVNDDVTVFADSGRRWRQGKVAKVPVMTGTIAEEGRSLVNHAATLNAFLDA